MSASEYDLMAPIGARIVPLYGVLAAGRVALVDEADYELVMERRWNVHERIQPSGSTHGPYAATSSRDGRNSTLHMHKLITGYAITDHKNHHGLDNQRSNLRPATGVQNAANSRKQPNCTSKYKGVCWFEPTGEWMASIRVHGKKSFLGFFVSEEDAAMTYDAVAFAVWDNYALLNLPARAVA